MKTRHTLAIALVLVAFSAQAGDAVRDASKAEIEAIRKGMERDLLDAGSARFNSVKIKGNKMCGLVNAKNRMGAYAGYRAFTGVIFKEGHGQYLAAPMGVTDDDDTASRSLCADYGIPLPP